MIVYKFHCEPPTCEAGRVRAQIVAAHHYRNEHVAIERGRRAAVRLRLEQLPSVQKALTAVKSATRSDRRAAREGMTAALRAALTLPPSQRALCRLLEEVVLCDVPLDALPHHLAMTRIERLAADLRRGARALTQAGWGSYQTVEASADQVRKDIPLYDPKGGPNDPSFRRMLPGRIEGQVSVHVQNRTLSVGDVFAGKDSWVRINARSEHDGAVVARALAQGRPTPRDRRGSSEDCSRRGRYRHGELHLRVGSEGRTPIWGILPIRVDRIMPDIASIKWVRVSCRQEGPWERWSCEITVELPPGFRRPREMAQDRRGTVALVVEWMEEDGQVRVGRWTNDEGDAGEIWLDDDLVKGLRKAEGIRSIRDVYLNEMRLKLIERLRSHVNHHHDAPGWIAEAAANGFLWKSPSRFHDLAKRWRREKYDGARDAYEILEDWEFGGYHRRGAKCPRRGEWGGDAHLYEYETGARGDALSARKNFYRMTAAQWAARYRLVVLEKRNLSFEARRPDEPGVAEQSWRQLAGVYELVGALRNAFGPAGTWEAPRRVLDAVDDEGDPLPDPGPDSLLDSWREAGSPLPEAGEKMAAAWARRKATKRARVAEDKASTKAAV